MSGKSISFDKKRGTYLQLEINPRLDAIALNSVAHVQELLPQMLREAVALKRMAQDEVATDANGIKIFKDLFELIHDAANYTATTPAHLKQFKLLVSERIDAYVKELEELCNYNVAALEQRINLQKADMLLTQSASTEEQSVEELARAATVRMEQARRGLYAKELTPEERAQMQKFGINPNTGLAEARLCITAATLLNEVLEVMEKRAAEIAQITERADYKMIPEYEGLNNRFCAIMLGTLELGDEESDEVPLYSLAGIKDVLENLKILFSGRQIGIEEYNQLHPEIKSILYRSPTDVMPFYGMIGEYEFAICALCVSVKNLVEKIESDGASKSLQDYWSEWLWDMVQNIYTHILDMPLDIDRVDLKGVYAKMINIIEVFRWNVITYEMFNELSLATKQIICQDPIKVNRLLGELADPGKTLHRLGSLFSKILENRSLIEKYCKDHKMKMREFLELDHKKIKLIMSKLTAPKPMHFAGNLRPLFAAISGNDYAAVARLVDAGLMNKFALAPNILSHDVSGNSFYAAALSGANVEIIAIIVKSIRAATEIKLRAFLRDNGFYPSHLNRCNEQGETPLTLAIKLNKAEIVLALLAREVDVQNANNKDETPMVLAINTRKASLIHDVRSAARLQADAMLYARVRARCV